MSVGCLNGTAGQLRNRKRRRSAQRRPAVPHRNLCLLIAARADERSHRIGSMPDDELTALVRAIAWELIQLGYVPTERPGFVQRGGREPVRIVAQETWRAMQELLQGAQP